MGSTLQPYLGSISNAATWFLLFHQTTRRPFAGDRGSRQAVNRYIYGHGCKGILGFHSGNDFPAADLSLEELPVSREWTQIEILWDDDP